MQECRNVGIRTEQCFSVRPRGSGDPELGKRSSAWPLGSRFRGNERRESQTDVWCGPHILAKRNQHSVWQNETNTAFGKTKPTRRFGKTKPNRPVRPRAPHA